MQVRTWPGRHTKNRVPMWHAGGYRTQMNSVPVAGVPLQFYTDSSEFLAAAGDYLAVGPVVSTVVTTVAHRVLSQQADGIAQPERNWWLLVRDASGAVVGAGMRTAPFGPYPLFLLPMPDEAAVALARALHEREEEVLAANGAPSGR